MKTEKQKKKDTYFPKRKYALKDWVNQKSFIFSIEELTKNVLDLLIEYFFCKFL